MVAAGLNEVMRKVAAERIICGAKFRSQELVTTMTQEFLNILSNRYNNLDIFPCSIPTVNFHENIQINQKRCKTPAKDRNLTHNSFNKGPWKKKISRELSYKPNALPIVSRLHSLKFIVTTISNPWYLHLMVAQNIFRTFEGKQVLKVNQIWDGCRCEQMSQIHKITFSLNICTLYSELPSNTSAMPFQLNRFAWFSTKIFRLERER